MNLPESLGGARPKRRLPRSLKELTPSRHFSPSTFFYELVWKGWLTRRTGEQKRPVFPRLKPGQVALTWIGHASFLIQFNDLNVLVDPNFANWLFFLKRLKRTGIQLKDLPPLHPVLPHHVEHLQHIILERHILHMVLFHTMALQLQTQRHLQEATEKHQAFRMKLETRLLILVFQWHQTIQNT